MRPDVSRGRKRKVHATVPKHIDQTAIPKGVYWDDRWGGVWYTLERDSAGVRRRRNIATRRAKLSELHQIAESRPGVEKSSLTWLLEVFHTSKEFERLAPRTKHDYRRQQELARRFETRQGPLGSLSVDRMSAAFLQRIVDRIEEDGHPTKANHLLRYLRRTFSWGIRRGYCKANPAKGVAQAREKKSPSIPSDEVAQRVLAAARQGGNLTAHTTGSFPPYLWIVAELAYLLRLRGIEVLDLSDASIEADGVAVKRRKGSRGNLTRWSPRLRAAWEAASDYRRRVTPPDRPVPIDPADRRLIVAQDRAPLSKSGLDSSWQRMMRSLVALNVIKQTERFGLHAMKHRGITDTPGTRADKQQASGHKTEAMLDVYDHSVPRVDPTKQ